MTMLILLQFGSNMVMVGIESFQIWKHFFFKKLRTVRNFKHQ